MHNEKVRVSRMDVLRILMKAVNLLGVRLGGAAMGLVSQILLARLLPQSEVGLIFLGMSATVVLSVVVTLGYPALAMTWLPRYYALGRRRLVNAFHEAFWHDTVRAFTAIAVAAALVVVFTVIEPAYEVAMVFALLGAPAASLLRINSAAANSQRRYELSYVPDFLFRPALLLAFLGAAWLLHWPLNAVIVLAAFTLIIAIVALGQAWLIGREGSIPHFFHEVDHDLAPQLRTRAAALIVVAVATGNFAEMVNLLGGVFLVPGEVALLAVAVRLAALSGFVTQGTQNFALRDLAEALTRNDHAAARRLLIRINAVTFGTMAILLLAIAAAGDRALAIFGHHYVSGYWALFVLVLAQTVRAGSGMNQQLLSLEGRQTQAATTSILSVAVLVIAAAVLAPFFGVLGVALAVLVSELAGAVAVARLASRLVGMRGDILALLAHMRPGE